MKKSKRHEYRHDYEPEYESNSSDQDFVVPDDHPLSPESWSEYTSHSSEEDEEEEEILQKRETRRMKIPQKKRHYKSSSDEEEEEEEEEEEKEKRKEKRLQRENRRQILSNLQKKRRHESCSSDEEEVAPIVAPKRKKLRRVKLLTSSSDEDTNNGIDKRCSPNIMESESQSDSDIEIVEVLPKGETTVNLNDYRFKESDGSNTYSDNSDGHSLDIFSECDPEMAAELNKEFEDYQTLVNVPDTDTRCDSSVNIDTPVTNEIQNQSIDSQTLNAIPDNRQISGESVAQSTVEAHNSPDDMSIDSVLSIESIDLSPDSPIIISEQINSGPPTVKTEVNPQSSESEPISHTIDKSSEVKSTPEVRPPQPQLPDSTTKIIELATPPNLNPYATTVFKQNKSIHIPAPPKLPQKLFFRILDAKQTIEEIKKRLNNDSDEIEAIEQTLKISLLCPITNKRVNIPSRSLKCHHFDCFDVLSFIGMTFNKKIDDWKCPKCKAPARIEDLIIDSLLNHILNHPSVDPSVESITFDNKAVWIPDIKLPEIHSNQNHGSDVINILDATTVDVIDIDDDDDDEEPTTPQQVVPPIAPKTESNTFNETLAAAKSVEQNISNLIQVNRSQTSNQREGNAAVNNTTDQIFLLFNDLSADRRQRASRWNASNNPQTRPIVSAPNITIPNPTFRQTVRPTHTYSNADTNRNVSQPQRPVHHNIQPQPNRPQPQLHLIRPTINNAVRAPQTSRVPPPVPPVTRPTNTSNSVNQSSSDSIYKFVYDQNGVLTMYCSACNESYPPTQSDQHNNSESHKTRTNTTTNTSNTNNTNNRSEQRNRSLNNNTNNNNGSVRPRPVQPVHQSRPPPAQPVQQTSYSGNYQYAGYPNYNQQYAAQQLYGANAAQYFQQYQQYQNYYQGGQYAQQTPPNAHQTTPTQQPPVPNSYQNNWNQTNGYYNNN